MLFKLLRIWGFIRLGEHVEQAATGHPASLVWEVPRALRTLKRAVKRSDRPIRRW